MSAKGELVHAPATGHHTHRSESRLVGREFRGQHRFRCRVVNAHWAEQASADAGKHGNVHLSVHLVSWNMVQGYGFVILSEEDTGEPIVLQF